MRNNRIITPEDIPESSRHIYKEKHPVGDMVVVATNGAKCSPGEPPRLCQVHGYAEDHHHPMARGDLLDGN